MSENKLSKLSSISEIISSLAVLLTLVYLALQTNQISKQTQILTEQSRQNTEAILSSSRQDALESELELIYIMLEKPHLYTYDLKLESRPEYSDEELLDILILAIAYFRIRENLWLQFDSGVLDSKLWESYLNQTISDFANDPFTKEVWSLWSNSFDKGFVEALNEKLANENSL